MNRFFQFPVDKLVSRAMIGLVLCSPWAWASKLDEVKARGVLRCGVAGDVPGFSSPDDSGRMRGIDASICDAVAAAVFGDATRVEYVPVTGKERFVALTTGEIDLLSRQTTHTLTRDASLGLEFTYYNYIDGQGFMVGRDMGVKKATDLSGATICVLSGTTTELNLADFFRSRKLNYSPMSYETAVQTREAFERGACDALTADKSKLAAMRTEMADPGAFVLLRETISKEPLGPVVAQGDHQWEDIVKFVLYALINAEEIGITSKNIEKLKAKKIVSPTIDRITGTEGNLGELLGLDNDWSYDAIRQVGNYGEIYARSLEQLGIPRAGSVNDLWVRGGLLYAPPMR